MALETGESTYAAVRDVSFSDNVFGSHCPSLRNVDCHASEGIPGLELLLGNILVS